MCALSPSFIFAFRVKYFLIYRYTMNEKMKTNGKYGRVNVASSSSSHLRRAPHHYHHERESQSSPSPPHHTQAVESSILGAKTGVSNTFVRHLHLNHKLE